MSIPLESFGMIGDGETAALISNLGSIDWLCLPRFDSSACCASLVGTPDHGHWTVAPLQPVLASQQRYEADTLILETDMTTDGDTISSLAIDPEQSIPGKRQVVELRGATIAFSDFPSVQNHGNPESWLSPSLGHQIDIRLP